MPNDHATIKALADKMEALERSNKRLKRLWLLPWVLLALGFLLAQAKPERTIEAQEIVIKDISGKVRSRLASKGNNAALDFYDPAGKLTSSLSSIGALFLYADTSRGERGIALSGTQLDFDLADGSMVSYLNADALGLHKVKGHMLAQLQADDNAGLLFISDKQRFSTAIGTSYLQNTATGEKLGTSGASVVLFDPKGKVLWQAP